MYYTRIAFACFRLVLLSKAFLFFHVVLFNLSPHCHCAARSIPRTSQTQAYNVYYICMFINVICLINDDDDDDGSIAKVRTTFV